MVSALQTEDPKYPFVSCNAALGTLQVRYCWACQRYYDDGGGSAWGNEGGRMMAQKRIEKHVKSNAHKAGVAKLLAVRHQAELAAKAFAKHERARERGEDISHKDHQKRLKAGRPIYKMSARTNTLRQRELVAAHR